MIRRWMGWERRWLLVIFGAIFPSRLHPRFSLGATDVDLSGYVGELCRYTPALSLVGLRAATWLIWWAPLLLFVHARPFGRLSADEQTAMLTRMSHSRFFVIREVVMLAKVIASLGFCALPRVAEQSGMPLDGLAEPGWVRPT